MRTLYLILISALLLPPVQFAAADSLVDEIDVGVRLGGGGATRFRAEGIAGGGKAEYLFRWIAGVPVELRTDIAPRVSIGLRLEPIIVQRGAALKFEGVSQGNTDMLYFDFLGLVDARYKITLRTALYVGLGSRVGVLLRSKERNSQGNVVQDSSDFYDTFDAGVSGVVGFSVSTSEPWQIVVEGRYDQGLTNIDDDSDNAGRRHRAFFLTLGGSWSIWQAR